MIKLLKIEYQKIAPYTTFWVLFGLYFAVLGIVIFGTQSFINEFFVDVRKNSPIPIPTVSLYNFPDVWQNITYLGGYFKIFLAVLIVILVSNEFSFRTIRQNIINGMSKSEFLKSKLLFIFTISLASTIFLFVSGLILGLTHTSYISLSKVFNSTYFLFVYLLELFAFLSFAMLIGFLVKKSGFAIGILLLYSYIIERILWYKIPEEVSQYFPIRMIGKLIDVPNTALMKIFGINFRNFVSYIDLLIVLTYTILFVFLTYLLLKKRDI